MELETNRNFKQTRKEAGKISRRLSSMELEMETNNSCLFLLLSVEIVADIFSRLPIDSVLQCKLVCKTCRDLIADYHHDNPIVEKAAGGFLLRKHFGGGDGFHYGEYYNDDKVPCFNLTRKTIIHHEYPFQYSTNWYIVGSCNGLICLCQKWHGRCISSSCEAGTHADDMYVCNPYTREYAKLPNTNYPRLDHPHSLDKAYGFGYHPITKEYKVIRIYYISIYYSGYISNSVYVEVYTLGSDTAAWRSITATAWGSIQKMVHKLYRSTTWRNQSKNNSWGILLNEVLYWLTETRKIISFDMADEEFRDISTTPEFDGPGVLGVLNGCLCFSTGKYDSTLIWVMNNNDYSWSLKFSIPWKFHQGSAYYPLACLESGKILLHCNFHIFGSYDPETEHNVEVKKIGSSFDIIPYMKSSVSLKALGEKEAIHVKALEESKMKKKHISLIGKENEKKSVLKKLMDSLINGFYVFKCFEDINLTALCSASFFEIEHAHMTI